MRYPTFGALGISFVVALIGIHAVVAQEDDVNDLHRTKRLIYKNKKKYWEKGIVPYKLAEDLDKYERDAVKYTMELYEKNTPIRFVPVNGTVYQQYGIKEGFAYFKHKSSGQRCVAQVGFRGKRNGQDIYCCWGDTCTHEIGHLLGFKHEMIGPKRQKWVNIVQKNLKPVNRASYNQLDGELFLDVPFDVYSPMEYYPQDRLTGKHEYTFNFPELDFRWKRHNYYLFQELCMAYKCNEYPQCQNTNLKCVNDGFISVVDNKCTCTCPPGFDPDTGCAQPINRNCGGVINLTNSKRTAIVEYDRRVRKETNCNWIIRGDPNQAGTLILNFDEFHLEWTTNTCLDLMWVTFTRLGHPGILECGPRVKGSIRSVLKDLRIELKSRKSSKSHFKATITWKPESELCYKSGDSGASYAGLVNYTQGFKPCVSWQDAMNNGCPINPFKDGEVRYDLQGNYCRNPDNSFRPWCYVDLETCEKNYCDVCGDENPFDVKDKTHCDQIERDGSCLTDHREAIQCADTCRIKERNSRVMCSKREIPGAALIKPKSDYKVGERAVYECEKGQHYKIERTCRSDGQWSEGSTPCTLCPIGWSPHEGKCYKFYKSNVKYDAAKYECSQQRAHLATPKSDQENAFINQLRKGTVIWLGAYSINKMLYLDDGSPLKWTNWIAAFPDLESRQDVHLIMIRDSLWHYIYGDDSREAFICQKGSDGEPDCKDFLDNCDYFMNAVKDVNCNNSPELHNLCRYSCGWCAKTAIQSHA